MFSRFADQCAAQPDAPFLIAPDGATLTYGRALARVGQLAHQLVALGVSPGDRVAQQTEKSVDALLLYLAALRVGAVFLPLNTAYTLDEIRYFLEDAEPALFVCREEDEAAMRALCSELGVPALATLGWAGGGSLSRDADSRPEDFVAFAADGGALAAILYTSGTTGRSKGAMLSNVNLTSNAAVLCEAWRFTAADRLLHALPIFHTHGLFVATNVTVCAGSAMILLPRLDADELIRLMKQATCLMGVPTFYNRLLAHEGFTRDVASTMRLFVCGSAPLSAETHRAFSERTGQAILERYGMTEANMITSNPYEGLRKPGSVGFPLSGISVRVASAQSGEPLPQGEIGVIEVKGPNVFAGYWRNPEKTAAEFRADGYFITGDLGFFDADGYLNISGREKDLIISGGFNIYPAEIESLLNAISGVVESAVIGLPHPDMGEAVVAVLSHSGLLDEASVLAALTGKVARFKLPRRVLFTSELPRNAMGKIQKAELRRRHVGLFTEYDTLTTRNARE